MTTPARHRFTLSCVIAALEIEISQGNARSVNAPDMRAAARDYA
jgi:hypothetical protein